jgi:CHAT domain-containing protein
LETKTPWQASCRQRRLRTSRGDPRDPQAQARLDTIASLLGEVRASYRGSLAALQRNVASQVRTAGPRSAAVADALHALSDGHAARGAFAQAHVLLARALALRRRALGDDHPAIAETLNAMSLLLVADGDVEAALMLREHTRAAMHTALENALDNASEQEILHRLGELQADTDALLSIHLGVAPDSPVAARLVFDSILRDKSRALEVIAARTALLRMHSRERIRRYFGDWQPGLFSWETQRRDRQKRAIAALEELGRLRTAFAASVYHDEDRAETRRLQAAVDRLERQVIQLVGTRDLTTHTSIAMVQRHIPENAALVELIQYRPFDFQAWEWRASRYAAYVVRNHGPPSGIDLGPVSDVDASVQELREAIATRRPLDRVVALARKADQAIMARIRPLLGRAREVFVAPDGMLHLLPFAALVDEQGRHLVEQLAFTYLGSGRDLVRQEERAPRARGVAILADPDFDAAPAASERAVRWPRTERLRAPDLDGFSPLPGTAREAAMLRELFPDARVWTGAKATEALLAGLQSPQILHIATHGVFLDPSDVDARATALAGPAAAAPMELRHPLLRAGLALAGANRALHEGRPPAHGDGILTALEITSLDLSGTELVVLSACDTGVGVSAGDRGLSGLRRALAVAGARTQVLSLWQVSDTSTSDLMKRYYQKVIAGAGRSAAMHETQRELLGRSASAHPFHWAAFIVSGHPGPLGKAARPARGRSSPGAESTSEPRAADRPGKVLLWALPGEPDKDEARGHVLQSVVRVMRADPRFTSIDPATITQARLALGLGGTTLTISQACRLGEMMAIEHIVLIDGYELGARSAEKRRMDLSGTWVERKGTFRESSVWLSVRLRAVDVAACSISPEVPVSGHGRYVAHDESALAGALVQAKHRLERHLQRKLREVTQP